MRLANSDMEADDCVSSFSISSSVLENSYGANVFFMGFHEADRLIYFISLLKQVHLTRTRFTRILSVAQRVLNPVGYGNLPAHYHKLTILADFELLFLRPKGLDAQSR
jgi:hypothetical protein